MAVGLSGRRVLVGLVVVAFVVSSCAASSSSPTRTSVVITPPPPSGGQTVPPSATPGGTNEPVSLNPPGLQSLAFSFLPGGSSAIADPCALLTDAEIKQATGHGVAKKAPGPQMGIFDVGCHWQLDDANASEITLGAISPGGRNYYETYLAPDAESHIAGVGDDAIRDVAGGVSAVKGDALVSIDWVAFPADKDMPVTLMRLALSHF